MKAEESMARVLVIGASGMLGSEAVRVFSQGLEVFAAVRSDDEMRGLGVDAARLGLSDDHLFVGFDAQTPGTIIPIIEAVRPDVVFNAAGIISQQPDSRNIALMITINSVWPHAVASICEQRDSRLVHVSTDCVFSGSRGAYTEDDVPDARDFYGRSKLLGEVIDSPAAVTLRTSIIGWQFGSQVSLAGWFAAHRSEKLKGYSRAVFSGLTTRAFCETVRDVVIPSEDLSGLYQVSVAPIDKYSLLKLLTEKMGWDVDLTPDESHEVNKSLDSSLFQRVTGWNPPSWDEMLAGLAEEYDHYYG